MVKVIPLLRGLLEFSGQVLRTFGVEGEKGLFP
jgi:hypothetical protein